MMQKDHMYAERGQWVTHVNTLSIITLQNIVPMTYDPSSCISELE